MINTTLKYYLEKIARLKRGGTSYGLAPHKPIFLLSLIDELEEQNIIENKIPINENLFKRFQENWKSLFPNQKTGNITQPLHYFKNEGFWEVVDVDGNISNQKYSSKTQVLKKVDYGKFETDFFSIIMNKENRDLFRMVILDTYFPQTKTIYLQNNTLPEVFSEIEFNIFEEKQSEYKISYKKTEGFVRDWKFRIGIMQLYDYTCCMSKMRVEPFFPLIQACHIKPHNKFGMQGVKNGIPLCLNLHQAFDDGLISLSDNYEILVKEKSYFKESNSIFKIRQLEGQKILLPNSEKYYPAIENIQWHRKQWSF